MDISSINLPLELIYTPKLTIYVIVTFFIICAIKLMENKLSEEKRRKITSRQRDLYYQKLAIESRALEEKKLDEELQELENVKDLQTKSELLLDDIEDEYANSDWDGSIEEKVKEAQRELEFLQEMNNKLDTIVNEPLEVLEFYVDNKGSDLQEVIDKIRLLEDENEELQPNSCSDQAIARKRSKFSAEVQNFLENHRDVITGKFLEDAYETILKFQALNPNKDLKEYIEEAKCTNYSFEKELLKLSVSKKEAELELDQLLKEYKKAHKDFNETRVEYIFKNCGSKEYLETLKKKYEFIDEENERLKNELESTRKALAECEKQYQESEQHFNRYLQASLDLKARRDQLEAEKRFRDRTILNHTMNLSAASSIIDPDVPPPPPPVRIPTFDELYS